MELSNFFDNFVANLNAAGDTLSPQHFTPPPPQPFQVTAVNGKVDETLPMEQYLSNHRLGSSTFAAIQKSELALQYEIQNKGNGDRKAYFETGTAVHSYIEAWSAGISLDAYLETLNVVPTFNRASKDSTMSEIWYYCKLLGIVEIFAPLDTLVQMKTLADKLRKDCESLFTFVSEKDAEVIKGIAAELQRRHNETGILDWLKYAKSEWTFFYGHFKARPDLLCDGKIISVKTCAQIDNAHKDAKYKYGLKEAFYRYVLEQVTGKPHETVFLFFETVAPYQSRLIYVSPETAAFYDLEVERYIAQVTRCIETNSFKGYDAGLEYGCEII